MTSPEQAIEAIDERYGRHPRHRALHAPSGDPVLRFRPRAYAVSHERRMAE